MKLSKKRIRTKNVRKNISRRTKLQKLKKNRRRMRQSKNRKRIKKRSQKGGGIFSMLGNIATLPFKPIKMAVNTALPIISKAVNGSNANSNPQQTANTNTQASTNTNNISNNQSNNNNSVESKDMKLYDRIVQNVESININNANITALKQLSDNNMVQRMPEYINHLKVIEI